MTSPFSWPGLTLGKSAPPPSLAHERGVWGKVHGAPSDFRWIARSPELGRERTDLERQLNLGGEDQPASFQAWRNLGDRCCAVTVYTSRATDAAGRRNFLEKQVLEWRRPAEVPAALGALLLLPEAASLTDAIWWDRYAGEPWDQPGFSLPVAAGHHAPLPVSEDDLGIRIERGRQALRERVGLEPLRQLYGQILRGQPGFLPGLTEPLPPEALAALLLPLPREIADRISLTGWLPSSRASLEDLASRWDVVVLAPGVAAPAPSPSVPAQAELMAQKLLATEAEADLLPEILPEPLPVRESEAVYAPAPARATAAAEPPRGTWARPGLQLGLTAPESEAPRLLKEIYAFARAADRRWLSPEALEPSFQHQVPTFGADERAARLLLAWVRQVSEQRPAHAHPEQWQVKVDLLRSAALVLSPHPSTLAGVGLPGADARIPALLFALLLKSRKDCDRLGGLGEKGLRQVVQQSVSCAASAWWDKVRRWLANWQSTSQRQDVRVQKIVADALAGPPRA